MSSMEHELLEILSKDVSRLVKQVDRHDKEIQTLNSRVERLEGKSKCGYQHSHAVANDYIEENGIKSSPIV